MQPKVFYRSFTEMNVREFFTNSWRMYGYHLQIFLLLNAIYIIILEGLYLLIDRLMADMLNGGILTLTNIAITVAAHRDSDGETIDVAQVYLSVPWKLLWQYFFAWILYFLIVFGGVLLFIIPGFIWAMRYTLAPHAVIVEGLHARQALSRSAELTNGKKLWIFLYELIFGLLFGMCVSLPITLITQWLAVPQGEQVRELLQALHIIMGNTLLIIFNVLLFKSLPMAMADAAS